MTLKELLIKHEGLRLRAYKCTAGKTTIGVGRNLEDKGITEEEAMFMLDNDIKAIISACRETFSWFAFLDNVRQAVVVSMVFNLGLGGFLGFKNTIAHIRNKDWDKAADNMLQSKWAEQVGHRALELAEMMRDGRFE